MAQAILFFRFQPTLGNAFWLRVAEVDDLVDPQYVSDVVRGIVTSPMRGPGDRWVAVLDGNGTFLHYGFGRADGTFQIPVFGA